MREKGINNMEWIDRKEWRGKIKLSKNFKCGLGLELGPPSLVRTIG